MTKAQRLQLGEDFRAVVRRYVAAFEAKHGCHLEFWVADDMGGIASFGDVNFFSLEDIRLDIDRGLPAGEVFDWINANLEAGEGKYINLYSWANGLRHDQLKTTP